MIPDDFGHYQYVETISTKGTRIVVSVFDKKEQHHSKEGQMKLKLYACKIIPRDTITINDLYHLEKETRIHYFMKHNNIVNMREIIYQPKYILIITDLCRKGDLLDAIHVGYISGSRMVEAMQSIILGLNFLHSKGYAHLDLKPENILIDIVDAPPIIHPTTFSHNAAASFARFNIADKTASSSTLYESSKKRLPSLPKSRIDNCMMVTNASHSGFNVFNTSAMNLTSFTNTRREEYCIKIADFGCCINVADYDPSEILGTLFYMAPEILNKTCIEPRRADIWSLGVIFYAMATKKLPFFEDSEEAVIKQIIEGNFKCPKNVPKCIEQVISACLRFNPDERPTTFELLQFPLFANYKENLNKGNKTAMLINLNSMNNICNRKKISASQELNLMGVNRRQGETFQ